MTRRSLVTILAEDQRQQSFAYQYLKRLGYMPHEIFREDLPNKGSGEQWVRLPLFRQHQGISHASRNSQNRLGGND